MNLTKVRKILKQHSSLFTQAYIFGSVARGEEDEWSDADLILVRETQAPFFERVREIMPLVLDLNGADLLIYTKEELESLKTSSGFIQSVLKEAIPFEGKQ